jgi:hypothetical protein
MSRELIIFCSFLLLLSLSSRTAAMPVDDPDLQLLNERMDKRDYRNFPCNAACWVQDQWKGGYCRLGSDDESSVCENGYTCVCLH